MKKSPLTKNFLYNESFISEYDDFLKGSNKNKKGSTSFIYNEKNF